MLKRNISLLLSFIIILSALIIAPTAASADSDDLAETGSDAVLADTGASAELADTGWYIPSETTFANRLAQLKEKYYPRGYSGAYYEDGRAMAWQCYGYAVQMLYEVFGIKYYADGFVNKADYTMGELNAGDVVRIRGNTHSIFITRVTDEGYYFTDANWDYNNGVRWDAYYTKAEMAATFTYKIHVPESDLKGTAEAKNGLYAETPRLKDAKCSGPGITVYWYGSEDASAYRVYYKKNDDTKWKFLGDTKNTYYQFVGNLEYGAEYTFTVRVLDVFNELVSKYDKDGITVKYIVAPPEMKTIKAEVDKITVGWAAVKGVTLYRLYSKASDETNWRAVANVKGTSYTFTGGKAHTTYQFTLRCLNSAKQLISGSSIKKLSAAYITYATQLPAPEVTSVAPTTTQGTIKLSWSASDKAQRFMVFYSLPDKGTGWKKLGTTTKTYCYYKNCPNNTKIRFTVRCVDNKNAFISDCKSGKLLQYFNYPENLNVVKQDENGNVRFSWKGVDGVKYYAVYYKTAETNGWQLVRTLFPIAETSYVFPNCENGVKYTFTVRACDANGKNISSFDAAGASITYHGVPAAAEAPTEAPTDAPADAVTEAPTEAPTDAPADAPSDAGTEPPTEAPTAPSTELPTAIVAGRPVQEPIVSSLAARVLRAYDSSK